MAAQNDHPQIEISCPHCGGASTWHLLQSLNQCDFCGSVLSWPYPQGEPDYLVAEAVVKNDEDLVEVLALYDAMREASRRRGAMRPRSEYDPDIYFDLGSGFSDTAVYDIKRERIGLFCILKSICVYVPYQLISSLLAYHVLGRTAAQQKVFRSLFFSSEVILPGYPDEWNFRDRGLRMTRQKLKPLASGKWSEPFLATGASSEKIDRVTRQWTHQRKILETEIHPICFHGHAIESHRWWVYRPFYFVHAKTPSGNSWFLVDGQFATIAGTPTADEINRVTRSKWKTLNLHAVRAFDIRIIPFRCPNCGWDIKLERGTYQICENCTRVLEVCDSRLKVISYGTVDPERLPWFQKNHRGKKVWLPFWRLEASALWEKKVYNDLSMILNQLVPNTRSIASCKELYIPAFDCWSVARYDEWAFDFGAELSATGIPVQEILLHDRKSRKDEVVRPGIDPAIIPLLFPYMAAAFAPDFMQARFNTLLIKRLAEMHVRVKRCDLVFVPAALNERQGMDPRIEGPKQGIEFSPLRDRNWPPMLQRTVHRWNAAAKSRQTPGPKTRSSWMSTVIRKI